MEDLQWCPDPSNHYNMGLASIETNMQMQIWQLSKKEVLEKEYDSFGLLDKINVNMRCQTLVGTRRGTVMFVGKIVGLGAGYWVGVKLDAKEGNSNGAVEGTQYFEAEDGYGTFLRPNEIETGDFPKQVEDEFDEDEDMI